MKKEAYIEAIKTESDSFQRYSFDRIASFEKDNPLKYVVGVTYLTWKVVEAYIDINVYSGYGHMYNIEYICNKYCIVNMVTGDVKRVEQFFLDSVSIAIK